jgi:hypothetical protein
VAPVPPIAPVAPVAPPGPVDPLFAETNDNTPFPSEANTDPVAPAVDGNVRVTVPVVAALRVIDPGPVSSKFIDIVF